MSDAPDPLLEAIRTMVADAVAPLLEAQHAHQQTLTRLATRLDRLEAVVLRIDTQQETLDLRTSQALSDLLTIRDSLSLLHDRVDTGLQSMKSDLRAAFGDIRHLRTVHDRQSTRLGQVQNELAALQQRLTAVEGTDEPD